jgi:hypothetical protein
MIETPQLMSNPSDLHLQVHGLRLHIQEWGATDSPPVMVVHGAFSHAHAWDHIAAALADRFRVIVPDLRGHGDSEWADDYAWERFPEDIVALADMRSSATLWVAGSGTWSPQHTQIPSAGWQLSRSDHQRPHLTPLSRLDHPSQRRAGIRRWKRRSRRNGATYLVPISAYTGTTYAMGCGRTRMANGLAARILACKPPHGRVGFVPEPVPSGQHSPRSAAPRSSSAARMA